MTESFATRAAALIGPNHAPPSRPDYSEHVRQGNLTYLQPGDIWQPNDFYEGPNGVMVIGTSSLIKSGIPLREVDMQVTPRRYVAA